MKNLLLVLAVVISGSAASARSILPPSLAYLSCSNAQGLNVSIDNYQGIGLGAIVTKRPVALPGQVVPQYIMVLKGFTPVSNQIGSMQQTITGEGFQMVIALESFAPTMTHSAGLTFVTNSGTTIRTTVVCQRVK